MVDDLYNRIVRYDLSGLISGSLPKFIAQPLEELRPLGLATVDSSMIFKLKGDRFVKLNDQYSPTQTIDLHQGKTTDGWQITSAFQFTPANGDIITFSDLKGPGPQDWKSAFLRVPLEKPGEAVELADFSVKDTNFRNFYKLGFPYVASLGSTAYTVMMQDEVAIYANDKGSGHLEPTNIALPDKLRKRATITYFLDPASFIPAMQDVEKSNMPVGLYGWEGSLYMLAREFQQGSTQWSLLKIDPKPNGRGVISTAIIPSQANHLMAVPGPQHWAFIEKGPVESFDHQEVRSALFVPSGFIRDLSSGVLCQDQ